MTYALLLAFFRNDMGFGGNNGLTDFKDILGFNVQADDDARALFAATAIALALAVLVVPASSIRSYGKVLVAVRDAESRTRFLGYRAENIKLFAFVVSAMMAGIAGALYVPQVGIINPGEFAPANSIEVVIWTAVGGRGTHRRPDHRRHAGQWRQELVHRRVARILAVRARRPVRRRHPVPAERHRRHHRSLAGQAPRQDRDQVEAPLDMEVEAGAIAGKVEAGFPFAIAAKEKTGAISHREGRNLSNPAE